MTARVEFCSALQFWNAKSKDCEIPPLPPTPLCVFQKSGSISQEFQQKAQPLSSRSGNKQYHCHSLPVKMQKQCKSTRRLHCENSTWCKQQSSNKKRSVSYSAEPAKIESSATAKCNLSTSDLLRTSCTPGPQIHLPSSPFGHEQSPSAIPTTFEAVDLSSLFDASTNSPQLESLGHPYINPASSTQFYNSSGLQESLSSMNMLLPSSQAGSNGGRHTPIYRTLATHTPILETLSPIPVRPFRPQCELWKLSDFLEMHGGTGGLLIDSHGRVFDNEKRYERFLLEEEQRQIRIDMEMEDLIAQARELVLSNGFDENEEHDESETVGDTAIIGSATEKEELLTDSLEDDNDEVWGRVDYPEMMDEREDWWEHGDDYFVSAETIRAAVTKILRVTNPDIPSPRGSLDSLGYSKHYTTPEASSISLLADISLEDPVTIPTFTNASTSPLLDYSLEANEFKPKQTPQMSENLPQPRRSLYEKLTHTVRSRRLTTESSSAVPTMQSRKRFPLEDDDLPRSSSKHDSENHASKRQKLTLKRDKKHSEDCGSISSIKPFRRALMNLSLRKYTINNASSQRFKASYNDTNMIKKENGPAPSSGERRKKRLGIDGFWGNFLHAI